ncbi:hypothetical protein DK254_24040 [Pseudomonas sp. RW407]|nr:hypothetical protein DK254_24040 [Pseudomonas sp. RW407]
MSRVPQFYEKVHQQVSNHVSVLLAKFRHPIQVSLCLGCKNRVFVEVSCPLSKLFDVFRIEDLQQLELHLLRHLLRYGHRRSLAKGHDANPLPAVAPLRRRGANFKHPSMPAVATNSHDRPCHASAPAPKSNSRIDTCGSMPLA